MVRFSTITAFVLAVSLALLWGCSATETGTVMGTLAGAGIGAGTGAIIGSATGDAGVGTAIGSGIGAPIGMAMGYAIGKSIDAEKKAEEAAAAAKAAQQQKEVVAVPPPPPRVPSQIVRAERLTKQVVVQCPGCNATVDITGFEPGERVRCPLCKSQFDVP